MLLYCLRQNPRVLMLDEPFNQLDPASRLKIEKALEQFLKQDRAVVLVSHERIEARQFNEKKLRRLTIGGPNG
jgi:ABC-type sulfate/molybdate transport systems ATPase subunit